MLWSNKDITSVLLPEVWKGARTREKGVVSSSRLTGEREGTGYRDP